MSCVSYNFMLTSLSPFHDSGRECSFSYFSRNNMKTTWRQNKLKYPGRERERSAFKETVRRTQPEIAEVLVEDIAVRLKILA